MMLWNKLLWLAWAATGGGGWLAALGVAGTVRPGAGDAFRRPPDHAEQAVYACAQAWRRAANGGDFSGPLFMEGDLVFASSDSAEGAPLLLLNAGFGTYAVKLPSSSLNKLSFSLPIGVERNPAPANVREFFLSYLPGAHGLTSRYFEFSEGRPPFGRAAADYLAVSPQRRADLRPQFEFALAETAYATVRALAEGRLARGMLAARAIGADCASAAGESTQVARTLRFSVEQFNRWASVQSASPGRRPASVSVR